MVTDEIEKLILHSNSKFQRSQQWYCAVRFD
ncbi:hypothetical protein B4U79_10781 [Dinothrombium tinctorium]|uniref:Uncharacterized protein n=1 Tax=Dinothrombium tinctorium TaxID=1965070 RepID=A0A443R6K8_9ACAR|nr:hypothetical protein B4U79_10781 [Dinothrombium tinctorium]